MNIRKLDPVDDDALLRQAFSWDADAPRWYADSDSICRPDSAERYMEFARNGNQRDVGIFVDAEMIGLITVDYKKDGIVELRLSAKRGAPLETLTQAAYQIRHQLFSIGMQAGVVWIAKKNRHVIKLCAMIGFAKDDVTMFRGMYHRPTGDRPIEWVRMTTTREHWLSEQVAA